MNKVIAIIGIVIALITISASSYGIGITESDPANALAYRASLSFLIIGLIMFILGVAVLYAEGVINIAVSKTLGDQFLAGQQVADVARLQAQATRAPRVDDLLGSITPP